jgi:thiol-disulfide isomerase/thioredoxin
MALHELETASAFESFIRDNANTVVCFSATWCGPCKASKPQLEALASSYDQDPTTNVKFGIVYEHNLSEKITEIGIRAFPTYILFVNNGTKEAIKIEGVDFDSLQKAITANGCKQTLGEGYSLGGGGGSGGDVKPLSAAEARAQRLAMFDKKTPAKDVTTDENTSMEIETEPMGAEPTENQTSTSEAATSTAITATVDEDVEMKDETETKTDEVKMVDPTANLSNEFIETLTGAMGFSLIRAHKGLLNGNGSVEGAVEWLMSHQDDSDIDEPIPLQPAGGVGVVKSYKCVTTGKILRSMADLELHANRTGHSDFEECTQEIKPLTPEEKAAKMEEIKSLLKAKRMEREEAEKADNVEREKERRIMGQQAIKTKEQMEAAARKLEIKLRKKEKDDYKKERARIRAALEKDKAERRANKGKLGSKLGIDGYDPDAIQYDDDTKEQQSPSPAKKKPKASVAKIDDYISKVSAYRAGGDGGKCLKILLAYIKNVVNNPDDDKFKHINMDNKVFKGRVKPFVGAKSLLLAVGFTPNKTGTGLDLDEGANGVVLSETKKKLEAALAAY